MSTLTLANRQVDLLGALRRLNGKATAGDLVAATGRAAEDVREGLKALLETHRGHLAVTDSGELLYEFDPRLIERGSEPALARVVAAAKHGLATAFKAWIVVMLVVYFVVFVVLVIAALLASQRGEGGRGRGGGWGGRGHRGGAFPIPNFWLWYWVWGPRWRLGRPYYGHRWERSLDREDKVPFYKKVFAFVFGPDRPRPTQRQLDRSTLRLIRARRGVLTTAELVEHTGLELPAAEEEMARLVGSHGGEPLVSPDGALVYAFPELMVSAHGRVRPREPNPAWMRLEYPLALTGNTAGANALVVGMNGFNLLAAATAPWFLFPRLGLGGPAAVIGLIVVPLVFSALFFGVPLLRMAGVAIENRRRAARNVRRVVLGLVFRDAAGPRSGVTVEEAHTHVRARLPDESVGRSAVEAVLHEISAELGADVVPDEDGALRHRFPELRSELEAGELVRKTAKLDAKEPGEVVFDTSDSSAEATERDQRLFDRALASGGVELDRTVAVDRVAFEADWDVVAFEDELGARGGKRRR